VSSDWVVFFYVCSHGISSLDGHNVIANLGPFLCVSEVVDHESLIAVEGSAHPGPELGCGLTIFLLEVGAVNGQVGCCIDCEPPTSS
jgi:hypothetical protein